MQPRLPYTVLPDTGPLPDAHIYGVGIRFWHWTNALMIVILSVTGYFIGTPPPSSIGDTSVLYWMGWIRFIHLAAGYLFGVLSLMRLWLAFTAGGVAHQLFVPAIWRASWLDGFIKQVEWNLLLTDRPFRYIGLNPLGNIAMILLFLIPGLVLILTGFAMYAEVTGHDSWQYLMFGWMTSLFGNTLDLHILHRLAMWVVLAFVMAHIYIAVREDVLSRQTTVSTMLSGDRLYRD
jgi:Ni/Fe-hydrogenase 1 B-type cytochrome subunit